MDKTKFKCQYCNKYHEIKKEFPVGFSGWAYPDMEWSDFEKDVPPLSEKYWERSDKVPKTGEFRIVKVQTPFEERIGDDFYLEYLPASVFFNDYENAEQIQDSAIVHCRFEEIILADEYSAWIKIKVLKVILLPELSEIYPPYETDRDLEEYGGMFRCDDIYVIDADAPWEDVYWTSEGEVGEDKMIYTDTNGIRHLVLMHFLFIDSTIIYFGNIVQKK